MKVLGRPIRLIFTDPQWEQAKYGMADPKHGCIYLADDLPKYVLEETLIHEVIHIICDAIRIELDEETVHRLGYAFYHFLIENGVDISRLYNGRKNGRKKA